MTINSTPSFFKHLLFASLFILFCTNRGFATANPKVLIFFKTAGFKHESIPAGIDAIIKLGEENKFDVDTTTNAENFTDENLKQYAAVIFLNTSGHILEDDQQLIFQTYINHG